MHIVADTVPTNQHVLQEHLLLRVLFPRVRVAMGIPIRERRKERFFEFFSAFEATPFQRQASQLLPPRLN